LVLILCEETDMAAAWAAGRLRQRGLATDVVTGADLAVAGRLEHRVGRSGTTFELALAGGRRLSGASVKGLLNRLSFIPAACLRRIGGPDRDYAIQEIYALYLSWLHALPGPLLNPPAPQGLCGNWRHPSSWIALAVEAGLPAAPYRQSSRDDPNPLWQGLAAPAPATVFVVGERVVPHPAVPRGLDEACRGLARAAGVNLLGIDFAPAPDGQWRCTGASVMPDLMRGGEAVVDALAREFRA
jgi:hypothetical protein